MKRGEFMDKHEVLGLLQITQCTLQRWTRSGKFPAAVEFSPKVHRWHRAEVEAWIARQPRAHAA